MRIDRILHGTSGKGEASPQAKLTDSEVRAILASDKTHVELAKIYEVCPPTIGRIRRGVTWTHIERGSE